MRRRKVTEEQIRKVHVEVFNNSTRWEEIKQIKRRFDAMTPEEQALNKPALAAEIDQHLAAMTAN